MPEDLHRPYIDEVTLDCEKCGGEMRRVESVIDTWYDSGAMPFAQLHYPFENEELFEERFPADFICEAIDQTRGWFYTLLAESTLLFDTSSYRNCVCLGLILDPEGQKMSKSKGNVVEPWDVISAHGADAFRWYYLTAQQPWSGYRFSVDTVGESVRQFLLTLWNTYSFWVLYANAEDLGPGRLRRARPSRRERPRPLGALAAAGDDRDRARAHGRLRLHRRRPGDRRVRRGALQLVRAALAPPLLGGRPGRLRDPAPLPARDRRRCSPRSPPSSPTRSTSTSPAARPRSWASSPTRSTCATSPRPTPALADPELEAAMEAVRLTVELGRAARAQAKAKMRQPLRRAVIVANDAERAAISARADLVTAELNVKELDFVSEEADLVSYAVKPNYRSLGPRFGKRMPQVAAAVEALDPVHVAKVMADGGEIGINVDGDEHTIGPDEVTLALQPLDGYEVEAEAGHAVALQLELDDELRREGLAREIVHAVQNARKAAGLDISDRIELALGGDDELLAAAREHEPYIAGEVLATSVAYDATDGPRPSRRPRPPDRRTKFDILRTRAAEMFTVQSCT